MQLPPPSLPVPPELDELLLEPEPDELLELDEPLPEFEELLELDELLLEVDELFELDEPLPEFDEPLELDEPLPEFDELLELDELLLELDEMPPTPPLDDDVLPVPAVLMGEPPELLVPQLAAVQRKTAPRATARWMLIAARIEPKYLA
jgi:hypothetical protein